MSLKKHLLPNYTEIFVDIPWNSEKLDSSVELKKLEYCNVAPVSSRTDTKCMCIIPIVHCNSYDSPLRFLYENQIFLNAVRWTNLITLLKTDLFLWNFGLAIPQNTWALSQILFSEKYLCTFVYLPFFA